MNEGEEEDGKEAKKKQVFIRAQPHQSGVIK